MRQKHDPTAELTKKITTRPNGRKRVQTVPVGKTRTQIQFQEQCNVNNIIAKYKKTGSVTHVRNAQEGVYADLSELPSLQEAYSVINQAQNAFQEVPAQVRQRFGHDPQAFIDFLSDQKNDEEAIKLGLKTKKPEPQPDPILNEIKTLNKNLSSKKTKPSDD